MMLSAILQPYFSVHTINTIHFMMRPRCFQTNKTEVSCNCERRQHQMHGIACWKLLRWSRDSPLASFAFLMASSQSSFWDTYEKMSVRFVWADLGRRQKRVVAIVLLDFCLLLTNKTVNLLLFTTLPSQSLYTAEGVVDVVNWKPEKNFKVAFSILRDYKHLWKRKC